MLFLYQKTTLPFSVFISLYHTLLGPSFHMMPMEEEESKMNLYQQLIQQKIKTITPEELVSYSQDYDIPLTVEQAKKILHIARTNKINVFDPQERKKWVKELAKITSPQIAKKANELFLKFVNKK
jgi:hypothetical protein